MFQYTEGLAVELVKHSIHVNAVSPGSIRTEMTASCGATGVPGEHFARDAAGKAGVRPRGDGGGSVFPGFVDGFVHHRRWRCQLSSGSLAKTSTDCAESVALSTNL